MATRPTVFVVQHDGLHNLDDATRYGDLHVIFRRDLYPDNAQEQAAACLEHARQALCRFRPGDYLCLVGSPLYTAICSAVLGEYSNDIRFLRYDKIQRAYYEVRIDMTQGDD